MPNLLPSVSVTESLSSAWRTPKQKPFLIPSKLFRVPARKQMLYDFPVQVEDRVQIQYLTSNTLRNSMPLVSRTNAMSQVTLADGYADKKHFISLQNETGT